MLYKLNISIIVWIVSTERNNIICIHTDVQFILKLIIYLVQMELREERKELNFYLKYFFKTHYGKINKTTTENTWLRKTQ
jgi:hypothetical protein